MKDELTAVVYTARATIVAVIISAVAMVVSCTQTKSNIDQAQKQFSSTLAEQEKQITAEQARWEKEQIEEGNKNAKHEAQIEKQLKLMQEANATQQRQNAEARMIAKENLAEWKLEWEAERRERVRPFLSTHQCCNPVGVMMVNEVGPDMQTHLMIQLPNTEEQKKLFKEGNNVGFAITIKNLGAGAAAQIQAKWIVERITLIDGSPGVDIQSLEGTRWDTIPNHIRAGDECEVRYLPGCIQYDSNLQIANVEGYLDLSCKDINGNPHDFKYNFWAKPSYKTADEKDQQNGIAYVHLHVEEQRRDNNGKDAKHRVPDQILKSPVQTPLPTSVRPTL